MKVNRFKSKTELQQSKFNFTKVKLYRFHMLNVKKPRIHIIKCYGYSRLGIFFSITNMIAKRPASQGFHYQQHQLFSIILKFSNEYLFRIKLYPSTFSILNSQISTMCVKVIWQSPRALKHSHNAHNTHTLHSSSKWQLTCSDIFPIWQNRSFHTLLMPIPNWLK